jgi:hypothetical protein
MRKLKSISTTAAGRAAMVAGCSLAADGVVQVLHTQRHAGSRVVGLAGNLNLAFFAIGLIAMAPALIALARYGRSSVAEKGGLAAAAGVSLLALGCLSSIVNQHDLAIFPAIAGVANLAWLGGSVVLGVSLKRAGRVSTAVSVGLPIAWILSIPLSTLGGSLISGAYFLTIGYLLVNQAIERHSTTAIVSPV